MANNSKEEICDVCSKGRLIIVAQDKSKVTVECRKCFATYSYTDESFNPRQDSAFLFGEQLLTQRESIRDSIHDPSGFRRRY